MSETDALTPAYFSRKGRSREEVALTKTLTESNLGGFSLAYSLRARAHGLGAGQVWQSSWGGSVRLSLPSCVLARRGKQGLLVASLFPPLTLFIQSGTQPMVWSTSGV